VVVPVVVFVVSAICWHQPLGLAWVRILVLSLSVGDATQRTLVCKPYPSGRYATIRTLCQMHKDLS
jgi:hypothetical protein